MFNLALIRILVNDGLAGFLWSKVNTATNQNRDRPKQRHQMINGDKLEYKDNVRQPERRETKMATS